MGLPISVIHDPIAHAQFGLSGQNVTLPQISGLGLVTFGFLWNQGDWALCAGNLVTDWSLMPEVTTAWSDCYTGVTTIWTTL